MFRKFFQLGIYISKIFDEVPPTSKIQFVRHLIIKNEQHV